MAKPKLLFYLKPEALEVYSDQSEAPAGFNFPPEIISHQEVFDSEKYTQALENFFGPLGIEELEIVVLISTPLIYSQEFAYEQSTTSEDPNKPLLDYNALNAKIQNFVDIAPFDNNQVAKLELKGENSSLVLLTNQALFKPIVDEVTKLGGRILSVVPVTIFPDLSGQMMLSPDAVETVFSDRKSLSINNFLLGQAVVTPETKKTAIMTDDEEDEEKTRTSKLLLIFGAIFILLGIGVLGVMLGLIPNPMGSKKPVQVSNNLNVSPQPTPVVTVATESAVPVGTASAALQEIKKDNLSVNITNGSGITGQGSKVKTILQSLGYKNININGTVLSGGSDTTITYSAKVSDRNKTELEQELAKTFLSVKSTEATEAAKYDIEIVTGLNK